MLLTLCYAPDTGRFLYHKNTILIVLKTYVCFVKKTAIHERNLSSWIAVLSFLLSFLCTFKTTLFTKDYAMGFMPYEMFIVFDRDITENNLVLRICFLTF